LIPGQVRPSNPEESIPDTDTARMLKLGNTFYRQGEMEKATQYYHRALPKLITEKDYNNLWKTYTRLAYIAKNKHRITEAISLANQGINACTQAGNKKGLINLHNFLGVLYNDIGIADQALDHHITALKLTETTGDSLALAIMLVNISGIEGPEQKSEYLYKAIRVMHNVKDDTARGYVFNTMGMYYLENRNIDSARHYFDKALTCREKVKDYQGISFTLNNIGEIYFLEGNFRAALRYYNEGLDVANSINDPLSQCIAYASLAAYYRRTGNDRESFVMQKKNLELARILQFKDQELNGLKHIADYYEKQNRPAEALKYFRLYDTLKDTLHEETRQRNAVEMQTRYHITQQAKEIEKLQSDNRIKTARIQRNRAIILSLIIGITMILTASWFMVRSYRDKLEAYKELVRKDIESVRMEYNQEKPVQPGSSARIVLQNALPADLQEKLHARLQHLMKIEKRYLDPELTLSDLARDLNTNTTYLSRFINDRFSTNFSRFINEYRINEARRMLAEPEHNNLSIEGIAQSVGFNSKSAFNQAFKAKTGVTPSFYQQSARNLAAVELPAKKIPAGQEASNYEG
jgi:AraC-like DNA-binding protein